LKVKINIANQKDGFILARSFKRMLTDIAKRALKGEGLKHKVLVDLLFINNETMADINGQTRGVAQVTDVLSFPMVELSEGKGLLHSYDYIDGKSTLYLGEILIAPDVVEQQADTYGHSWQRELGFLFCHGIYHLLGYDHMESDGEKIMLDKQEKVLASLNITR